MVSFWLIAVVCCLLAFILPYAIRVLHPITVLFLWIVVAALEQFCYAIVIINMNFVAQSGKPWDFAAIKLLSLVFFPLLAIESIAAAFSPRLPIAIRLSAWFVAPLVIIMSYSYFFHQGILVSLHWGTAYSAVKNFGQMAVFSLAAWGCQALLRKKGLIA